MISQKIVNNLKSSSWIRAMFEEGQKLRKLYGAENVYDFTLGNPDPEPPESVKKSLMSIVKDDAPETHRYMSNAGFDDVRQKVAEYVSRETGVSLAHDHIIMTCGAAGGLNVVLKTLLDPGDEIILFAPYFAEYLFYIDNHGGKAVVVPTVKDSFEPDLTALKNSINKNTKAILINSPNNPSGFVYSRELLENIEKILKAKEQEYSSTIYVLSDEPYTKIIYDGVVVPPILKIFQNSFVINSFSKSLSLPGERIGYIAVNPGIKDIELLLGGLVFCNRILGYVNAPSMFQKVIADSVDKAVDVDLYKVRRDLLYNNLVSLGFSCMKPQGAFYLFP
ncbi:MAG: pyridoxal phosphate-dependent aminotransferase, partial [Clostridiaceae bacterium]|nr:pyridoxal phosphate-dependent aminotransferase [Clostridiaceae bacterium]